MPGEAPGDDRGHVTPLPGTNAGPVIDRLWARAPRGGGLVPSRPAPTGYRQWPTRRLGAMLGAVPGWLPFAALAAVWAGAVMYGARRAQHARLRGGSRQITDVAALRKRLAALSKRAFKEFSEAADSRDIDGQFLKLRRKLDEISRDSSGFFPEANDMTDEALRSLIAAREAAKVAYREGLDARRRDATIEAREARRRARPWET